MATLLPILYLLEIPNKSVLLIKLISPEADQSSMYIVQFMASYAQSSSSTRFDDQTSDHFHPFLTIHETQRIIKPLKHHFSSHSPLQIQVGIHNLVHTVVAHKEVVVVEALGIGWDHTNLGVHWDRHRRVFDPHGMEKLAGIVLEAHQSRAHNWREVVRSDNGRALGLEQGIRYEACHWSFLGVEVHFDIRNWESGVECTES